MSIDGSICAYDVKTSTFYYPISTNIADGDIHKFCITFGVEGEKIYINNDKIVESSNIKVKLNKPYKVKVVVNSCTHNFNLILTRLPTVMLMPCSNITKEDTESILLVNDPNYKANKNIYSQITSNAIVSIRGQTSSKFAKKSYKLRLTDDNGLEINYPLVGMRNDGDWILDAMFNDFSRMRKKVLMELWSDMSTVYYDNTVSNGVNSEYVEVFINDEYQGLYLLRERVDRKQLHLEDNKEGTCGGIIYKGYNWGSDGKRVSTLNDAPPAPQNAPRWGGIESVYPQPQHVKSVNWKPFHDLAKLVVEADDAGFINEIGNTIDYDNIAEYFIFVNLLKAGDNMGKNIIWSIKDTSNSKCSKLMITPWDLDTTMGRDWKNREVNSEAMLYNNLFRRLIELNPDSFIERVQSKWFLLRQDLLTIENLQGRYEAEQEVLCTSGALDRESNRWSEYLVDNGQSGEVEFKPLDVVAEVDYIFRWTADRLEYLDEQIKLLDEK